MKKRIILIVLSIISQSFLKAQEEKITPAHVYQLVKNTHRVLDLIREHEKIEKYNPVEFAIQKASPREVFFQAIGLLNKTNTLCFSYTREVVQVPSSDKENLTPKDVYAAVNLSYKQLSNLKKHLNIQKEIVPEVFSDLKTPNDVFRAIIQLGRQISAFDEKNITPSDVYHRVSSSFIYANTIYFDFRDVKMIEEPKYIEGKTPSEVYGALLKVISVEREICDKLGKPFAEINEATRVSIKPSDVSDLAGLALSEIKFLATELKYSLQSIQKPIYTDERTPSHVFQRVKHLHLYLMEILRLMDVQPNVLKQNIDE